MCYHNYTQHNGCGHIGEMHNTPWTLCSAAQKRLSDLRGPMSPPLFPAAAPAQNAMPSRKPSKLGKILSAGLSRSATSSSSGTYRTVSGASSISRTSTSSTIATPVEGTAGIPDHQLEAVKCTGYDVQTRTNVSSEMEVCKECQKWIREMRFLIERYDKTGSVKGTTAYEEFLKFKGDLEGTVGLYR